ncbi:MAG: TonB family protein [Halioglobus sp.]
MTAMPPLRLLPAFIGAMVISLAIFLFMQSLIKRGQSEDIQLVVYENVEILRQQPEPEEPENVEQAPQEAPQEPLMEQLQMAPPTSQPKPVLEMPSLDLGVGDIDIRAVGNNFSAPLGAGGVSIPGGGQDAKGFVEVVPYNTRRPNVPDVAWQNKINGWVLVAFTVTPRGETRDVRVLDAKPRGVFEEKVIAAVEDWQYSVKFAGKSSSNVVLTQRVEVRWQDFPNNLPNVD